MKKLFVVLAVVIGAFFIITSICTSVQNREDRLFLDQVDAFIEVME